MTLKLLVPSGIGDISWVYSKVLDVAKVRDVSFSIAASHLYRAEGFVKMLPHVEYVGPGGHVWPYQILDMDTDLSKLDDGVYGICANPFLESGIKLSDIHPHQPTHYHYPLNIPAWCSLEASKFVTSDQPRIGIYTSSYQQHAIESHKSLWCVDEWLIFLTKLESLYPDATFYFLGAEYDDKCVELAKEAACLKFKTASGVGRFKIGTTIEIIKRLDYFFAFPSGLGILADVVDTPCMMWYYRWDKDGFLDSYADPVTIAAGKHLNLLFASPDESFKLFCEKGRKWLDHRIGARHAS